MILRNGVAQPHQKRAKGRAVDPNVIEQISTQSPEVAEHRFRDIEELEENLPGWTFHFRQLDRGALSGEYAATARPGGNFVRIRLDRRFHQTGAPPERMHTYTITEESPPDMRWCGSDIKENTVQAFSAARDFDAINSDKFCGYILSFPEDQLARTAESLDLPEPSTLFRQNGEVSNGDPELMRRLRQRVRGLFERNADSTGISISPGRDAEFDFKVQSLLLRTLASQGTKNRVGHNGNASLVVKRALEFIDAYPDEPATVAAVAEAARVSRRTLNYAFRSELDATPKQYLQAMRLDSARRELRRAASSTKIADVANESGFWHLGQFAADYRRQFGELPSETLARQ